MMNFFLDRGRSSLKAELLQKRILPGAPSIVNSFVELFVKSRQIERMDQIRMNFSGELAAKLLAFAVTLVNTRLIGTINFLTDIAVRFLYAHFCYIQHCLPPSS
jgi:hypothetical protein